MKKHIISVLSFVRSYYVIAIIITVVCSFFPLTKDTLAVIYNNYYSVITDIIGNRGTINKIVAGIVLVTTYPISLGLGLALFGLILFVLIGGLSSCGQSGFDYKKANQQYLYSQGLQKQQNKVNREIEQFLNSKHY